MCKDGKILKEDIELLLQQIISKRSGKDFRDPRTMTAILSACTCHPSGCGCNSAGAPPTAYGSTIAEMAVAMFS